MKKIAANLFILHANSLGTVEFLKRNLLLFFIIILPNRIFSQSKDFFVQHGDNIDQVSCNAINFATITNANGICAKSGSVYLTKPIDLKQSQDISFVANFTDVLGEDGGAFVFVSDSGSLGEAYSGLGYRGIKNSLGITFDLIQDNSDHDPSFDHVAIQANGDIDHNSSNNLAGPVSIENLYLNLSGKWFHRLVNIKWDPAAQILSVYIQGNLYLSLHSDIVKNIFNGNSLVYWGFTGSNTQLKYFSIPEMRDITFGYLRFSFGEVDPRFSTYPSIDSCYDKPIQFTDMSRYVSDDAVTGLDLFKWYWDFGDGTTSNVQNPPLHAYPGAGIYQFKYTVTNQLGCTVDTLEKTITLGSTPVINFSNTPACLNTPIKITDLTQSPIGDLNVWAWSFDNGALIKTQNPIVSFSTIGLKTVALHVQTVYGCKADTVTTINVTDKPIVDFSFSEDCDGLVGYISRQLNSINSESWQWDFGDSTESSAKNPSHLFLKNGSYTSSLYGISSTGCASDTVQKLVVIDKLYPLVWSDTIIAINQPLQLIVNSGTRFQWTPAMGLNDAFISNPIAILSQDQSYTVDIKNNEGCEGSGHINIKVYKGPEIYVPTGFTPNNDGLNDIFHITVVGFKSVEALQVFNRYGQLVFYTADLKKGWDGSFSGLQQPAGAYVWFIKGVDYKGNNVVKKGSVELIR